MDVKIGLVLVYQIGLLNKMFCNFMIWSFFILKYFVEHMKTREVFFFSRFYLYEKNLAKKSILRDFSLIVNDFL